MKIAIFILTLMAPMTPRAADPAIPAENKPLSQKTVRYKLGDVKTPYDPFTKSIESSQPPLISLIASLGLAIFFRKGSLHFGTGESHVAIQGSR